MPSNTRALVDQVVEAAQAARSVPLANDIAFELFAAGSILRPRNLSDEEVAAGRIGGGGDGGIDSVHVFLDGMLLSDDADVYGEDFRPADLRRGVELELVLTQAKRETSFTETAIDKVVSSLGRLLDLESTDEQLQLYYSRDLVEAIRLFTRAWTILGIRSPAIRVEFSYVTRGEASSAGQAVVGKLRELGRFIEQKVPRSTARASLTGCDELWEIASASPSYDLQLRFREYSTRGDSYVGLVSLADYFSFLCDEAGLMRAHLFDWNVRDFQGDNAVNREIKASLEVTATDDFWWLNNGVTVLCSEAAIGGDRRFTLRDVQIVNGMQTSQSLYSVISAHGGPRPDDNERSILVRVIQTQDEDVRDRIIRATNSQTRVPDASLHATEPLHRQIEAFFAAAGWFYDRRKNFYRNAGKPSDRIISIGLLGQATMAIGLSRPNDARARPTTLLNRPDDYSSIFSEHVPLGIYLWLAQLQRGVDLELARHVEPFIRSHLRFHVSSYIATQRFGEQIFNPRQLAALAASSPDVTTEEVFLAETKV